MSRHPSREALQAWLDGEDSTPMKHVEACDRCLGELEELSRLDPVLVRTFRHVTRPAPGFIDRVMAAIESRRREAETWSVLADLFSLGWRTIDTVWYEDG